MSRTHSIMRIATTASPVSGSEVRFKMLELAGETRRKWAVRTLQLFFRFVRKEKTAMELEQFKREHASAIAEVERMREDAVAREAVKKVS